MNLYICLLYDLVPLETEYHGILGPNSAHFTQSKLTQGRKVWTHKTYSIKTHKRNQLLTRVIKIRYVSTGKIRRSLYENSLTMGAKVPFEHINSLLEVFLTGNK